MRAASLNDLKKEMQALDAGTVRDLCLRLARFKKENKELLTYLLFEAVHEQGYIETTKEEVAVLLNELPTGNVYFIKKSLRKVLRLVNRQVRYSGVPQTELDLRIHFCMGMKEAKVPLRQGTVLYNLYQQQVKKITGVFNKLPEDLQADYQRELDLL